MKFKVLVFVMASIAFASCKEKQEETIVTEPEMERPDITVSNKECFEYVTDKDTIRLVLTKINGENVSGDLAYRWYEKDGNVGTVSGMFKGDTLFADYTFQSEGMTSVRETVFVRKGNTLVQGFGDVELKEGKQVFKNSKKLEFDGSVTLNKVACE